ncbi:MAG TPA: hypothetical protein VEV21_04400 [Burkholderiales bacterium]|nr:hypothetical protein [Burkholderiales bacterium]
MADERDPQISQRYRQLGTEEPSPELDRAILGAARRATSRHRWYSSLAAAAVLIFAVALVVQIERQPPDQAPMSAPATPVLSPRTQDKVAPQEREAPPARPAPRRRVEQAPAPPPAPAPQPSANIAAPMAGAAAETRTAPQVQRSMGARLSAATEAQANLAETPEQWLERIARMRQLGRDEEAEKELARFRERYPDYRIPEAMAKKLEKQAPSPAAR